MCLHFSSLFAFSSCFPFLSVYCVAVLDNVFFVSKTDDFTLAELHGFKAVSCLAQHRELSPLCHGSAFCTTDVTLRQGVLIVIVVVGGRGAENDGGQQPGTASGRVRDDGQCDVDLLGQDGNSDDQQDDCRSELHLWYVVPKHS